MQEMRAMKTVSSLQPADDAGLRAARVALACLDLTSLNEGDDEAATARLCRRATGRFGHVAAVCVWPRYAALARSLLPETVRVAAVANFPAGGGDAAAALRDVQEIVAAGAQEVDVVLPWRALSAGDEAAALELLRAARGACEGLTLKVILETGALREPALIERASKLALQAGADFLKTSTGKVPVGATLPAAEAMLRVIAADARASRRVGIKFSGGLRQVADVAPYLDLVERRLGADALQPARLRIGASSLLDDLEAVLGGATSTSAAGDGY
jgi:deoxyribose-phosphate aldolase